jgi:stage II sporulation protein AA (anti-sigma F factor antagonist)
MTLENDKVGDVLVVQPVGQINSANATGIEADLMAHIDKGERKIVLDLSRLDYISSAGLRVVLLLAKTLKQNAGKLVLCSIRPQVHEVFDISGFLAILSVADTREQAIATLA